MPGLGLWETILQRRVELLFWEDNTASIQILDSGRSPPLRHLGRTHGISLAWLHEQTTVDGITLSHCDSAFQLADIFTKPFDRVSDWQENQSRTDYLSPRGF